MTKPKLFIGSSSESLAVAKILQKQLARVADVQRWDQGAFRLSQYPLDSLLGVSQAF
jgi:predicted nucleotide-binding protein